MRIFLAVVKPLLEAGADVNIREPNGISALDRAEQLDDDTPEERRLKNRLIVLLKQHGAKE